MGVKKFLALKRTLKIPVRAIRQVSTESVRWIYAPVPKVGTHLPRVMMAGTFWTAKGKTFYYMRDARKCVTLTLKNQEYYKIIFQVENKDRVAQKISNALG